MPWKVHVPESTLLSVMSNALKLIIMKELNEIFAELVKQGAVEVKNLVVKNVYVTNKGDYSLVTLKVNKDVTGNINEDDEYKLVDNSRTIFCYDHDIMRVVNEMPGLALFKRMFVAEPSVLESALSFAKVDIVQYVIKANEPFVSPFSGREHDVRDYDTVRTYIKSITLGEEGEEFVSGLRKEYQKMMIQRVMSGALVGNRRNRFDDKDDKD